MKHKAYMRKQGGQYIVCTWDESVKCYRESIALPYHLARYHVGVENCPGERGGTCRCASHVHHAKVAPVSS